MACLFLARPGGASQGHGASRSFRIARYEQSPLAQRSIKIVVVVVVAGAVAVAVAVTVAVAVAVAAAVAVAVAVAVVVAYVVEICFDCKTVFDWVCVVFVFFPDLFSGCLFVSDFAFVCFLNICCSIVL